MKIKKSILSVMLVVALCLSMASVALAGTATADAKEYGTLTGTLTGRNYTTTVTTNPDNAYLTIKGSGQNALGQDVVALSQIQSSRGVTSFAGSWVGTFPKDLTILYGTHGVQGGSKYAAAAVYTATTVTTGWW